MNSFPWLTLLWLLPMAGGLVVLGLDRAHGAWGRRLALAFAAATAAVALTVAAGFDTQTFELQFVERHAWVPVLAIDYFLAVDGLSIGLVVLTAIIIPMAILCGAHEPERGPAYHALMLFLQAGLFGTFTALNFVHWFIFWELSLLPAFLLIRLWGGLGRAAAATQFFIYAFAGSVALLLGFLAIYLATGSFDFIRLAELGQTGELNSALSVKLGWYDLTAQQLAAVVFGAIFLGFAVKVPLMPFHTWLPAAYAEAPSSTTMVLTGLMSKMGIYGALRILWPLFPEPMRLLQGPLLFLAVMTIVLSVFAGLAQRDLKRALAYSSINHLGYCWLGLFALAAYAPAGDHRLLAADRAAALNGISLQMFSHGLIAATLFAMISFIEKRTGGVCTYAALGGLRQSAPVLAGLMGVALFASLGLPGLSGFVAEFLIFKGVFGLAPLAACVAVFGLLLSALLLINIFQGIFYGPLPPRWSGFRDLAATERCIVAPAIAAIIVLGICPQLLLQLSNATLARIAEQLR